MALPEALRHDSPYAFSQQFVSTSAIIIFAQTRANERYGDVSPIEVTHEWDCKLDPVGATVLTIKDEMVVSRVLEPKTIASKLEERGVKKIVLVSGALLLMLACTAVAPDVVYDFDEVADFFEVSHLPTRQTGA